MLFFRWIFCARLLRQVWVIFVRRCHLAKTHICHDLKPAGRCPISTPHSLKEKCRPPQAVKATAVVSAVPLRKLQPPSQHKWPTLTAMANSLNQGTIGIVLLLILVAHVADNRRNGLVSQFWLCTMLDQTVCILAWHVEDLGVLVSSGAVLRCHHCCKTAWSSRWPMLVRRWWP